MSANFILHDSIVLYDAVQSYVQWLGNKHCGISTVENLEL